MTGGPRPGAGRPPLSPTGERRRRVAWSIAPSVRLAVEAEAARRGVSTSALVEMLLAEAVARLAAR